LDQVALRKLLDKTDSINFSFQTAREYIDSSTGALNILSPSDAHDALRRMAAMVVDREQ